MRVLTSEQARTLLDVAKDDRLCALYVLALSTGMRQGELLGLRWRDVDLDRGSLQVRTTLQKVRGQGLVFVEPKTSTSRRTITLSPSAVGALRQHRTRQLAERMACGPVWQDGDLVFPDPLGRPMDGIHLLRYEFVPLLKHAGLPAVRFHDLRHTAATLLLLQGVHPKVVQEMLGHATISITLDTYSHVLPNMHRDASMALEQMLWG
jgi:integrase